MNVITIKRTIRRSQPQPPPVRRRSIREISSAYCNREHIWNFAVELLLFLILTGISAWPIVVALRALHDFLPNPSA